MINTKGSFSADDLLEDAGTGLLSDMENVFYLFAGYAMYYSTMDEKQKKKVKIEGLEEQDVDTKGIDDNKDEMDKQDEDNNNQ